jgi:hypothetical protein
MDLWYNYNEYTFNCVEYMKSGLKQHGEKCRGFIQPSQVT